MTPSDPLREQVAAASRELAAAGLVRATNGNVSARDGDRIAITPTGGVLGRLRAEDIAIIDADGVCLRTGRGRPPSWLCIWA